MNKKVIWIPLLALAIIGPISAAKSVTPVPTVQTAPTSSAPSRIVDILFKNLSFATGNFTLNSINNQYGQIEFNVRNDEVVSQAVLNLQFTPSPSLIPIESQIKIYLNDELMGVVPITQEQLGHSSRVQVPIDARYITDFNRLRISFIGHYTHICENPANSTLWADISNSSSLSLTMQTLPLQNDLTHFPQPFFDKGDNRGLILPMVFGAQANVTQQRAAAILASWFGSKAKWLNQSYPVLFNQLPQSNAIVFATNSQKPDFLKNVPNVKAPTIAMIDHPENPYIKLLLIMGRDDNDLITAVKGIAQGNILFRGQQVTVDKVEQLIAREPYDAPNWIRTNKVTTFAELQQYKDQLQTNGINPYPISLPFSIPPDLYLKYTKGVDMHLIYRYTTPSASNISRLNISLNDTFVRSYALTTDVDKDPTFSESSSLHKLFNTDKNITLPTLALRPNNQLSFDFDYSVSVYSLINHCETNTLTTNYAIIDGNSTIDLTDLYHYIVMPDLQSFTQAGFPFSRMADLSETMVLVGKNAQPDEVSVLLNTLGNIGSKTGYPALSINITDDWSQAKNKNVDILIIGSMPQEFRDNSKMNLLMQATQSWIKEPLRQNELPNLPMKPYNIKPKSKTTVSADGAMAAVIGVQSPFYGQRSIIALLADSPEGFHLLNKALTEKTKLGLIFGSVAVIREFGIDSLKVGSSYTVGHIPWWVLSWYALQSHPILLAVSAAFIAFLIGIFLWRVCRRVSRRRLFLDNND